MPSFSALYIENQCRELPLVESIIKQCPNIPLISCERYGEVFNRNAQNFRLQKRRPGLILAKKHHRFVLPAPAGYGFGNQNSYYFSHLLNCPYDCRYCFLQGMYRSAHNVLFVNYDDFKAEIAEVIQNCGEEQSTFYSGYDCDSLAFESYSHFAEAFLPFFKDHPLATLELRTKSAQIQSLLRHEALPNVVVAMSFSTAPMSEQLEHRVPSLAKRITAAKKIQQAGWPLALRFEPLIAHVNSEQHYHELFRQLFDTLDVDQLHSVSTGVFRMPQAYFKNMLKHYPDEPLFALHYETQNGLTSYPQALEEKMIGSCEQALFEYIPKKIYYHCGLGEPV